MKIMTITSIFLFYLFTSNAYGQKNTELDTAILKKNLRTINSIKNSTDNSDLAFLDDELKDIEILMLGEQSHGDGSTFLAKTRLIKYLHEKGKFNVLVFESGLADIYRIWAKIQENNRDISVFEEGIFKIWSKSKQTEELFKYILEKSKTDNPLYIAGLDMQPSGTLTPKERWDELNGYLKAKISFEASDYTLLPEVLQNTRIIFTEEFTEKSLEDLKDEFQKVKKLISEKDLSDYGKTMSRYMDNLLKTIVFYKKANFSNPPSTTHVFNIRDYEMAKNLMFIKEQIYPDKKLMIWGANSHLGYNRGLLSDFQESNVPDKGMIPMGAYLKTEYQDKIYSMAFTSYTGALGTLDGSVIKLEPAHELTLESKIAGLGFENAFLSLKSDNIKPLKFATRIYGHGAINGVWGQIHDGIFFIKNMEPNMFRE